MNEARFRALQAIRARTPIPPLPRERRPREIFGEHIFSKSVMRQYLSEDIYRALIHSMESGAFLAPGIAGPVAAGIKAWAIDRGATHYTHWFQPLTGRTAEKHESLLDFSRDAPIDHFSGEELTQQEPDASAFPSGGLRTTFEARGYTAWDCSSSVFILDTTYGRTLCIPSVFVSYTGAALDFKTPLLRSISLVDEAATQVCRLFDSEIQHVTPTVGAEQEYFLVDLALADLRPDLLLAKRTLFGAPSARGKGLNDHYFGAIPERVYAFMNELENDAHRLGIPLKTRHNEVAPGQFECAPQFETINLAVDHSLLVMDLIERTARKHQFLALLHEKPFAGINGSGKHSNWSLMTDTGRNLLAPGSDPESNLMFLAFFVCVISGVAKYPDLMGATIASSGNDMRLGKHEAPPNTLSVFLGRQLDKVLNDIENPPRRKKNEQVNDLIHLGIASIPELLLDNTDRNRTSPFAFTGNKFEFRAVGASANISHPMMILNVIVAEQLNDFHQRVQSKINRGRPLESAILDIIRDCILDSKKIRFEGDGYSESWRREANERGLTPIPNTPDALDAYLRQDAIQLLERHGIFSKQEIKARHEVLINKYLSQLEIEADLMEEISLTQILPVAFQYQADLTRLLIDKQQIGLRDRDESNPDHQYLLAIQAVTDRLEMSCRKLVETREAIHRLKTPREQAKAYAYRVVPLFEKIRKEVDQLERQIPDARWPLPKYRELLFVR